MSRCREHGRATESLKIDAPDRVLVMMGRLELTKNGEAGCEKVRKTTTNSRKVTTEMKEATTTC